MKILHITNYYQEGFGYQENCLIASQKKLGHNVRIITSDYYFPFPNYDRTMKPFLGNRKKGNGNFKDKGVVLIRKKSILSNSRPGFIYFSIAREVFDFYPDIVHVYGVTNTWLPQLVNVQKKVKFKLFIDVHQDFSVENYSGGLFGNTFYFLWRLYHKKLAINSNVNKYLPITEQSSEWLEHRLGVPIDMHKISPLGVDLSMMSFTSEGEKLRKKWGAKNKLVIVNAGKQYKEKKIHWVIEIICRLSECNIDVFLVLIGSADESYDALINKKLSKLSKSSWIRLPFQNREELQKIYSASDVGIWPGIPSNTIQEAMACGVALFLPNDNIVGQLIEGNGYHIPKSNKLMVEYLCALANSKKLLKKMKLNSIELAKNKYSCDKIASDLVELYRL
jgi:glycosyltransferase involved in cell wall biosynthesis